MRPLIKKYILSWPAKGPFVLQHPQGFRALCGLIALFVFSVCSTIDDTAPHDRLLSPERILIAEDHDAAYIFSTNADGQYSSGHIQKVALSALRNLDNNGTSTWSDASLLATPYEFVTHIPSLADNVKVVDGDIYFTQSKWSNELVKLGALGEEFPLCQLHEDENGLFACDAKPSMDFPGNDPIDLYTTTDPDGGDTLGILAYQSFSEITLFKVGSESVTTVSRVPLPSPLINCHSLLRMENAEGTPFIVGLSEIGNAATGVSAGLALFWLPEAALFEGLTTNRIQFQRLDDQIPLVSGRSLAQVNATTLTFVGRNAERAIGAGQPDLLVQLDVEIQNLNASRATTLFKYRNHSVVCDDPNSNLVLGFNSKKLGVITCFADNTVMTYNPLTLVVSETFRNLGRGPVGMQSFDIDDTTQGLLIPFYLDNSLGFFKLVDNGAELKLNPIGRIGEASIAPEDGR